MLSATTTGRGIPNASEMASIASIVGMRRCSSSSKQRNTIISEIGRPLARKLRASCFLVVPRRLSRRFASSTHHSGHGARRPRGPVFPAITAT
jgi:hypothetical protein